MRDYLLIWKMMIFFRNMIDRYVNDEFRAVDRDFSNCETLIIFYLCRKCLLNYRFFCYVLFKDQSLKKTRLVSLTPSLFLVIQTITQIWCLRKYCLKVKFTFRTYLKMVLNGNGIDNRNKCQLNFVSIK